MDSGAVIQIVAITVPIIGAVIIDGVKTRMKVALLEQRQTIDREAFDEHRHDLRQHWATPCPPAPKGSNA